MRRIVFALVVLAGAAALLADNVGYTPDPEWHPTSAAAERPNPLADRPQLAAGGAKLFQRHCSECHGENGGGVGKAADLRLDVVQRQSDGAIFWKITQGNQRRKMPSFSNLPELQRWQLVLHIRSLREKPAEKGQSPVRY